MKRFHFPSSGRLLNKFKIILRSNVMKLLDINVFIYLFLNNEIVRFNDIIDISKYTYK